MKRITVTYHIEGGFKVTVDAETPEKAVDKANKIFLNTDFGMAEDVEGEIWFVEDDNGNALDVKYD